MVLFSFLGCDSADLATEVTLEGRVVAEGNASVEGAAVTVSRLEADGQRRPVEGEARTDAQGRFALTIPATTDALVVEATNGSLRAAAALEAGAASGTRSRVAVPTLSARTTAQTEVFVAARAAGADVDVADAAAHVGAQTASWMRGGAVTATRAAAALRAAVEAETRYAQQAGSASAAAVRRARAQAYADLRAQLQGMTEQARAFEAFEEAYVRASAGAGLSLTRQAEASVAGASAAARFAGTTDATAAFRASQQARALAALALALAVEQEFRAAGASQGRLHALAQARTAYVTAVRAATSAQALADAAAAFRSAVRAELAAQAGVTPVAVDAALAATSSARATLDTAVASAADAAAVAQAHAAFFAAARQAAQGGLGAGANLAWAASVVALLSVA